MKFTKEDFKTLIILEQKMKKLRDDFDVLKKHHTQSTFSYFFQKNWWKLGTFLTFIAVATGATVEFFYHFIPK
jgi:hypothetical protein